MANEDLVGYPTGGITAFALRGAAFPTKAQMEDPSFVITDIPGWTVLGLRTSDGAPEWAESPAAPEEVYEEGYEFSPQNGTLSCTQTLAEMAVAIFGLLRGVTYVNGVADIDIDRLVKGQIYTEDRIRTQAGDYFDRYAGPLATVTAFAPAKKARGSMANRQLAISLKRSSDLDGGAHYRHAYVGVDSTPEPFVVSITPAGQAVGEDVVISGGHFTGMTGVTVDAVAVVSPLLASDDMIVATIPTGASGAADVIVTTADGSSAAYSYTVGA